MRKMIIGVVLAALATPALASNWVMVGMTSNSKNFVDTESIGPILGRYRQSWVKSLYEPPASQGQTHEVVLWRVDCLTKTRANKSWVIYFSPSRESVSHTVKDQEMDWAPVLPDTIGETVLSYVCKYGK